MFKNLFCTHKDEEEIGRYYKDGYSHSYPTFDAEYWVEIHKVFKCKTCSRVKDEVVLTEYSRNVEGYLNLKKEFGKMGYITHTEYVCK